MKTAYDDMRGPIESLLQFLRLKTTWHCLKCNKDDYDDYNRDDSKSADDDNGYEDDIGEDIFEDDGDERYDDSDVDCNTMIMMTRKEPEAVLTRKWRWRVNDTVEDLESESRRVNEWEKWERCCLPCFAFIVDLKTSLENHAQLYMYVYKRATCFYLMLSRCVNMIEKSKSGAAGPQPVSTIIL